VSGAMSGDHARDLSTDLDTIAAWNASVVVTLVEAEELKSLQIPKLGQEVARRFMEWHHWPIADFSVPTQEFEEAWPARSEMLRALLGRGGRVLVHCKGGLGRAGMIAARLLVEMGDAPADAIARVREARGPGAIETTAQEAWVKSGKRAEAHALKAGPASCRDRALGALIGLAVGDAVGTTIEFSSKPEYARVRDMVGGGPFGLEAGEWTDDTAMAVALAHSLLEDSDLDPTDLMMRFAEWVRYGTYSCQGACIDIGNTIKDAIFHFLNEDEPLAGKTGDEFSGNGALMRLAPVPIRHWPNRAKMAEVADLQTRTTHGSPAARHASEILASMIADAIQGKSLAEILNSMDALRIAGGWRGLPRAAIRGSGYVVHSLQAAVWAVARTTDFRSAILLAANLGEDADTTAAVTGQLAGAIYGLSGIPSDWLDRLAWRDELENLAGRLFDASIAEA